MYANKVASSHRARRGANENGKGKDRVENGVGRIVRKRMCISLLAAAWLLAPVPAVFPGSAGPPATGVSAPAGRTDQATTPGRRTPARGNYSLLAPVSPFSFFDLLTVSPIGETRAVGPGRATPSSPSGGNDFGFFPTKSTSYLFSTENAHPDNRYVGFAWLDRFDLGQASRMYANELRAELMVGYSLTGLSSILFGMGMQLERPGVSTIRFQDDGWRFKFIKKF